MASNHICIWLTSYEFLALVYNDLWIGDESAAEYALTGSKLFKTGRLFRNFCAEAPESWSTMRASRISAHTSTSETSGAERREGINKLINSCFTSTLTQRGEHNFAGTTGKQTCKEQKGKWTMSEVRDGY
jgi:hypothetical protein